MYFTMPNCTPLASLRAILYYDISCKGAWSAVFHTISLCISDSNPAWPQQTKCYKPGVLCANKELWPRLHQADYECLQCINRLCRVGVITATALTAISTAIGNPAPGGPKLWTWFWTRWGCYLFMPPSRT